MDREQRDLLLSLGYTYLACGLESRALPLLLLAKAASGDDLAVLRCLAYALVAVGRAEEALAVVERLELLEGMPSPGMLLLRSRALHQQGRHADARACFAAFVARRAAASPGACAGACG